MSLRKVLKVRLEICDERFCWQFSAESKSEKNENYRPIYERNKRMEWYCPCKYSTIS